MLTCVGMPYSKGTMKKNGQGNCEGGYHWDKHIQMCTSKTVVTPVAVQSMPVTTTTTTVTERVAPVGSVARDGPPIAGSETNRDVDSRGEWHAGDDGQSRSVRVGVRPF